jgi:uncharacterized membrane protein YdjX (TVP38/TMEM64 family)
MSHETSSDNNDRARHATVRIVIIAIYVIASIGLYFVLSPTISNQEQLQSRLEDQGVRGIATYILLYGAQMFVPWLPGAPLDIIGGAVFGFWETTLMSILAASASGLIIYVMVKQLSLENIVRRFPGLLDSPWRLVEIIKRQPWAIVAVNLLTGDAAYFIAGSARIPVVFTIGILAAMRVPSVMIGTAIGAGIVSNVIQQKLDIMVTVATIITVSGLTFGFALARKYLPNWLERLENNAQGNSN